MAYNDPAGHTRAFEEHGWDVVKKEMGIDQGPGVEFVGRYNEEMGRHEAYFRSKGRQTIKLSDREVTLDEGELLNIEWSFKVGSFLVSPVTIPPFTGSACGDPRGAVQHIHTFVYLLLSIPDIDLSFQIYSSTSLPLSTKLIPILMLYSTPISKL